MDGEGLPSRDVDSDSRFLHDDQNDIIVLIGGHHGQSALGYHNVLNIDTRGDADYRILRRSVHRLLDCLIGALVLIHQIGILLHFKLKNL